MKKILILTICLLSIQANAVSVMPEVVTTVSINPTDINRIHCRDGFINSIDYAGGTGLIHKFKKDKKNAVILFQQLDDGLNKKIISSKVNVLIGCANTYFQLVLDPVANESTTINLVLPFEDIIAKKKEYQKLSFDEQIIKILKDSRNGKFTDKDYDASFNLNGFSLQLIASQRVRGTNFRIKKFVVKRKDPNVQISENLFIDSKIDNHIVGLSLDDHHFNDKNWTMLHAIIKEK